MHSTLASRKTLRLRPTARRQQTRRSHHAAVAVDAAIPARSADPRRPRRWADRCRTSPRAPTKLGNIMNIDSVTVATSIRARTLRDRSIARGGEGSLVELDPGMILVFPTLAHRR